MKKCETCKILKKITDFCKNKSQHDGIAKRCRACVKEYRLNNLIKIREYHLNYYYKNREKLLNYAKKRYTENPETFKKSRKKYYEKNVEKIQNKNKNWIIKNKNRHNAIKNIYRKNNPELFKEQKIKRRVSEKQARPKWANLNKIREIYKNCPEGYVVDHIVPLNSNFVCGLHVEHNLQYLTSLENSIKNNSVKHLEYKWE